MLIQFNDLIRAINNTVDEFGFFKTANAFQALYDNDFISLKDVQIAFNEINEVRQLMYGSEIMCVIPYKLV